MALGARETTYRQNVKIKTVTSQNVNVDIQVNVVTIGGFLFRLESFKLGLSSCNISSWNGMPDQVFLIQTKINSQMN